MASRLSAAGYPDDWPAIARATKERAFWRCQRCAAKHGAWGSWTSRGFVEVEPGKMALLGHGKPPFRMRLSRGGYVKVVEVMLAAAHLNHTPSDCRPENLRALCQRCHLAHDERQHVANAAATRHRRMGTADLF